MDDTGGELTGNEAKSTGGEFSEIGMESIIGATMNGLPEDYQDEWNNLSSRIQKPADLAKNYIEAQRMARSSIRVPGEDAGPEAWEDIYNKLGRPESPDGYQFLDFLENDDYEYEATDQDKQFRQAFAPIAHKLGLSQSQVSGLEAWQFNHNMLSQDAMAAQAEDLTKQNVESLQKEFGADFERNRHLMAQTAQHYGGDDFDQLTDLVLEDGTAVLDHPAVFRMLSKIGAERQEDYREPNAFNADARMSAQAEWQQVQQDAVAKGLYPSHPDWPAEKLLALSDRMHGKANVLQR